MFKSIRWTLFAWYALILSLAIGAVGGTLYHRLTKSMYREADGRLRAHAQAVAGAIGDGPVLTLSPEFARLFPADRNAPYYAVWSGGTMLGQSVPGQVIERPVRPQVRTAGTRREVVVAGPHGTFVLVGQRLSEHREDLREFLVAVLTVGASVIVFALAGGWFIAAWGLRPVRRMSEAAEAISASNLSQRIDEAKIKSELGRLARTLNDAFDRLQQAFDRQTRFTADASHELRTPLSVILSQAELALKKERTIPEYQETLETTLRASQRMKAVVEGLLTLARADAKELDLRRAKLDLRAVVEETASMLAPLAQERKVTLTVGADPVEVDGDRDRLREAVSNLLTNAIRYNRDGGSVTVALHEDGARAVLSVADTGIGIPEKDRPHVFDRFYRVDQARSRDQGGSGLGLAITRWIVESHGGVISVDSREGEGSTFIVRLPLSGARSP